MLSTLAYWMFEVTVQLVHYWYRTCACIYIYIYIYIYIMVIEDVIVDYISQGTVYMSG